jgi:L-lactate dehydrogenase (cytochrome)
MSDFLDFSEMRASARRRLPRAIFDYIDRGTEAETAVAGLRKAFDRRRIVQRALRDVSNPDLGVDILGTRREHPMIIAPTALAGLVRYDGEIEIARGAARAGLPYCAATQASTRIEEIVARSPQTELWFQLYPWRDRTETLRLIDRVRALGIGTLLVTVDTPGSPKKVHNQRNGFTIPLKPSLKLGLDLMRHPGWSLGVMGRYWVTRGIPSFDNYPGEVRTAITRSVTDPRFALATNFERDLMSAIRDRWPGHLIVKGIQHPDDAELAVSLGAQGVVISSHGGRNLDSLAHPLSVLPAIRNAIGGRALVLADSGIRRGSDIAKLIGAGADAVLAGRAFLWALAISGEAGVPRAAKLLIDELRTFMAFAGMRNLSALREAQWIDSGD